MAETFTVEIDRIQVHFAFKNDAWKVSLCTASEGRVKYVYRCETFPYLKGSTFKNIKNLVGMATKKTLTYVNYCWHLEIDVSELLLDKWILVLTNKDVELQKLQREHTDTIAELANCRAALDDRPSIYIGASHIYNCYGEGKPIRAWCYDGTTLDIAEFKDRLDEKIASLISHIVNEVAKKKGISLEPKSVYIERRSPDRGGDPYNDTIYINSQYGHYNMPITDDVLLTKVQETFPKYGYGIHGRRQIESNHLYQLPDVRTIQCIILSRGSAHILSEKILHLSYRRMSTKQ